MIEVNEGIPVQVSLSRNAVTVIIPVGLNPLVIETISEADADEGPKVRFLGYTDAVIPTLALVIVMWTVAMDVLSPFVAANSAL